MHMRKKVVVHFEDLSSYVFCYSVLQWLMPTNEGTLLTLGSGQWPGACLAPFGTLLTQMGLVTSYHGSIGVSLY
jgi:hypothetical protein